ncbi:hypothetical protein VIBHAR_06286 [Vibrio campbellii ATCC BAA-1116]|uniref:Uncharacterized protein n=1 Tax=Vibrio campbellii (strain ATCC BAA-1116) TaxID=2902295 RepID=A7N6H1_VIBC1|nr:hypothetical protein VIBHAR_06286 [Vibrio campbellii ATCC BAA-1116]
MKVKGRGFLSFLMFLSHLVDTVFLKKFLIIFLYPKCNILLIEFFTIFLINNDLMFYISFVCNKMFRFLGIIFRICLSI